MRVGALSGLSSGDAREPYFPSMLANLTHNIKRERKRAPAIFERHQRRGALPHRVQKRSQLRMQRFFGSDRRFGDFNLRIDGGSARRRSVSSNGEDEHFLASVIDGDVLVRLEETQLAHAFGGN